MQHRNLFQRRTILCALLSALTFMMASYSHASDDESATAQKDSLKVDTMQIVVTASQINTPLEEVSNSLTVVTGQDIDERKNVTAIEALNQVPGVGVVQSGGAGGNASVFLRGANPEHTLVIVDGVEVNNPITTGRSYNFSDLTLDNVDRIEVLRGPQSSLYGSDALGGVINIVTRRGDGAPRLTASTEAGSYNSYTQRAQFGGGSTAFNYSLGVTHQDSDSISAADRALGNSENDAFHNTGVAGRIEKEITEQLRVSLTGRYQGSTTALDNRGGVGGDDLNRSFDSRQYISRGQLSTKFFDSALEQTFGVSYNDNRFEDENDPDALSNDFLRSSFSGELVKFDNRNVVHLDPTLDAVVGAETERERADSFFSSVSDFGPFDTRFPESSQRTNGLFAELQGRFFDRFFPIAGVRFDNVTNVDSKFTWRIAPTFLIDETRTKLFGSVGTGFKAPSLFQRYSSFGNLDLEPEEVTGGDLGIEQRFLGDKLTVGISYFQNDFDNLIIFDPNTFVYSNLSSSRTQGIELSATAEMTSWCSTRLFYTYTDAENIETGQQLLRRPRNRTGAELRLAPSEELLFRTTIDYTGPSFDDDFSSFPATRTKLDGFVTVHATGSYHFNDQIEIFVRAENLFDESYQTVVGYGEPGAMVFAGLRFATEER